MRSRQRSISRCDTSVEALIKARVQEIYCETTKLLSVIVAVYCAKLFASAP
jgi:hypothetical protein